MRWKAKVAKPRENSSSSSLKSRGLIDKIEPTSHVVPHGDRSGAVLEPFLTDQWYVDAKTLAQPAIAAVRERKTVFVPAQWEATFFNWMDNIQPWCISRQIWWGHQNSGVVRAGRKDLRRRERGRCGGRRIGALHRDRRDHRRGGPRHRGRSGAARAFRLRLSASRRGRARHLVLLGAVAVLDLGWPDETPELKRFYPTSTWSPASTSSSSGSRA